MDWPRVRLRGEVETDDGLVEAFLFQIEYNVVPEYGADSRWLPVARMNHDIDAPHDLSETPIHVDVYDTRRKTVAQSTGFPAVPFSETPEYCARRLTEYYVDGFRNDWEPLR